MSENRLAFPGSLGELLRESSSFYEKNKEKMSFEDVRKKRARLSEFGEVFHKECGTLTSSVQKKIEVLRNGGVLVLMAAHQPNLFAYSGVYRKATLTFVLAQKLEDLLKVPVVSFFGIADQDFTDDRWVRSCQLPAVQRSGGTFSLDMKLPEKCMLNKVASPSQDVLKKWKVEIEKWLRESAGSIERLCKTLKLQGRCRVPVEELRANLEHTWSIVEDCGKRSRRYSDFNAFTMSKIVNEVWGYDTVFARFSECEQTFVGEFNFLLLHAGDYSRLLLEMKNASRQAVDGGVSDQEPWLAPFWYHCTCGSKAKLFMNEQDGHLFGTGTCSACGEQYKLEFGAKNSPSVSGIASRISARAIAVPLVFFRGLMPSCYVGGVGGVGYLMEAEHVAKGLEIAFPPIAVWRPRDRYLGVGQVEASVESKRICNALNVPDLFEAKALLESRLRDIRGRLRELDESKSKIVEELRLRPNDEELRKKAEDVSMARTELIKSSGLSVISHELKVVENVSTVFTLIPSVIDYAVNVGLEGTSDQWIEHLIGDGSLSSDVNLRTVLSQSFAPTLV
jgi:hypothetical protein